VADAAGFFLALADGMRLVPAAKRWPFAGGTEPHSADCLREGVGRQISPSAALVDSQSVLIIESAGPRG
jgi:hypothetical protein